MPNVYPPYTRYSPLFFKPKHAREDFSWEGRFGNFVEDVVYEWRSKTYWIVGHVAADGVTRIDLKTTGHPEINQPVMYLGDDVFFFRVLRTHYGEDEHRIMFVDGHVVDDDPTLAVKQPSPPRDAPNADVHIKKDSQLNEGQEETFSPIELTVEQGTVVCWNNDDDVTHTCFSGTTKENQGSLWKSPYIRKGGKFMRQFNEVGTYEYTCLAHPWMHGKVTVVPKPQPQEKVFVSVKQKKNTTLLAFKNSGNESIFGVKIKVVDGKVRFVSARSWEREKVDPRTVMIKTSDRPVSPNTSLIVTLLLDNPNASYEWTVYDKDSREIATGSLPHVDPSALRTLSRTGRR